MIEEGKFGECTLVPYDLNVSRLMEKWDSVHLI